MNCPMENTDNVNMVLDYCAGKLPELQAEGFERHMQACLECRDFVRSHRQTLDALDDWQEQPISADFDRRLQQRIREVERRPSWRQWLADKASWRPALSIGAACAAAAVILLIQVPEDRDTGSVDVPSVVENTRVEAIEPEQVETALDDLEMLRQLSGANNQSL